MAVDVSGLLLSTELKERSMFLVASLVTTRPQTPPAAQFGADGDSYQPVSARATAVHDLLREAMGSALARMRSPRPSTRSQSAKQSQE